MNTYKQIIEAIRKIKDHMRSTASRWADEATWAPVSTGAPVDDRLIQALDNAAQKAADLAVIATEDNDRELYGILCGLKSFGVSIGAYSDVHSGDNVATGSRSGRGYDPVDGDY